MPKPIVPFVTTITARRLKKKFNKQEEKYLIEEISKEIYPTTQIISGQTTMKEYVETLADFLASEVFSRRMPVETLRPLTKLAILRHNQPKE